MSDQAVVQVVVPEAPARAAALLKAKGWVPGGPQIAKLSLDERREIQVKMRLAAMQDVPEQQKLDVNKEGAASGWRKRQEGDEDAVVPDKRNHLTLVELKRLLQMGNIPRSAWEPITYLHQEAAYYLRTSSAFQRILNYLETLVLTSQSVDGYRSEQTVQAMVGERAPLDRHGAYVANGLPAGGESRGLRAK